MSASVALVPARIGHDNRHSRLRQLAKRIHALGERPLYELLVELDEGAELRPTLEAYGRLEPLVGFIREHGGDRLPGPRVVNGGRMT
jgi:hypothetical protein